jgi:hypothetical protein
LRGISAEFVTRLGARYNNKCVLMRSSSHEFRPNTTHEPHALMALYLITYDGGAHLFEVSSKKILEYVKVDCHMSSLSVGPFEACDIPYTLQMTSRNRVKS